MTQPTDAAAGRSPYERALGSSLHALRPRLRAYFAAIPQGHVGYGRGTFEVVGTPRRVLWPILSVPGRLGIAFRVYELDVPFSIENRPRGASSVAATRRFEFATGARVRARFEAALVDGALELRSNAVGLSISPVRLCVPDLVAPRVHLIERFDDTSGRQHVRVTVDLPVIGRLYEYSGSFTYEIRPEAAA